MGEVSGGLIGWAVITVQHSTDAGTLLVYIYLYVFPHLRLATLLDNHSGLLSMLGWAHITQLCKDIGKEVDTVFDPNTQRFGSSLEVGHTWKRFQTASAPPAERPFAAERGVVRAVEMQNNKVNLYFPAVWKCFWRTVDTPWQIHWSEIPSFRDHDLFSQMHYLWKKASVLQNQLKTTRQNGRIKNQLQVHSW